MVMVSFQERFEDQIVAGTKFTTIRKVGKSGKCRFKTGQRLQLYTAIRTKNCRKLVSADPVVKHVFQIDLAHDAFTLLTKKVQRYEGKIYLDHLAILDGFEDYQAMWDWFMGVHGLDFYGRFYGHLIVWEWPANEEPDRAENQAMPYQALKQRLGI